MHTISTKQIGIASADAEPMYEITVTNQRGRILHISCCYECDLDRRIDELQTGGEW